MTEKQREEKQQDYATFQPCVGVIRESAVPNLGNFIREHGTNRDHVMYRNERDRLLYILFHAMKSLSALGGGARELVTHMTAGLTLPGTRQPLHEDALWCNSEKLVDAIKRKFPYNALPWEKVSDEFLYEGDLGSFSIEGGLIYIYDSSYVAWVKRAGAAHHDRGDLENCGENGIGVMAYAVPPEFYGDNPPYHAMPVTEAPIINAPRYEHECEKCIFLGNVKDNDASNLEPCDLYFCPQVGGDATVIARRSSEPSDYMSGLEIARMHRQTGRHTPLREALNRAEAMGLLPRQ